MLIIIFLVKIPAFMIHIWLPKAHVEAPVSGSIILAGILLKIGGYGMIKFIFLIKKIKKSWNPKMTALGVAGSIIIRAVCIRQTDLKVIIAYSSVAHISTVISSISMITKTRLRSSIIIIISHGLCSACIFYSINIMYEKIGSRNSQVIKGLRRTNISIILG